MKISCIIDASTVLGKVALRRLLATVPHKKAVKKKLNALGIPCRCGKRHDGYVEIDHYPFTVKEAMSAVLAGEDFEVVFAKVSDERNFRLSARKCHT